MHHAYRSCGHWASAVIITFCILWSCRSTRSSRPARTKRITRRTRTTWKWWITRRSRSSRVTRCTRRERRCWASRAPWSTRSCGTSWTPWWNWISRPHWTPRTSWKSRGSRTFGTTRTSWSTRCRIRRWKGSVHSMGEEQLSGGCHPTLLGEGRRESCWQRRSSKFPMHALQSWIHPQKSTGRTRTQLCLRHWIPAANHRKL